MMDHAPYYLNQMVTLLTQILSASGGGGGGTWTDASGTVTLGGTSQVAIAANAARTALLVQNPTSEIESLYINFGAAAVIDNNSIELTPGGVWSVNSVQSINIIAATTGHKFIAKQAQ